MFPGGNPPLQTTMKEADGWPSVISLFSSQMEFESN